jgi:hypothetical protein
MGHWQEKQHMKGAEEAQASSEVRKGGIRRFPAREAAAGSAAAAAAGGREGAAGGAVATEMRGTEGTDGCNADDERVREVGEDAAVEAEPGNRDAVVLETPFMRRWWGFEWGADERCAATAEA